MLRAVRAEAVAVARDETLRTLLSDEQIWLRRAQDLVREVRRFREREIQPLLAGRLATMGCGGGVRGGHHRGGGCGLRVGSPPL